MRGLDFNEHWRFTLEEKEAPHLLETDDSDWEEVRLPHDWSVLLPFDKEKGVGCTGYLMGGIGWYRKTFVTTKEMEEKRVVLQFDGIYNRSNIYCNGQLLTFHPYGYSPLLVDITDYLGKEGEENCVAVKVDHTRYADSRWYTGSGIYRKVSMFLLPKVHIPVWGTFFTTRVTKEKAEISGKIQLKNTTNVEETVEGVTKIFSPDGEKVDEKIWKKIVYTNQENEVCVSLEVENPKLWDIYQGNLYKIETQIILHGEIIQKDETMIGLRWFTWDVNKGFFINGKNTKIKGVCLHHDAGSVGVAVPLDVWKRRLEGLISCGCNAIRTAHNPASEDFLDLCDSLGLLVQEEFYDEWDFPKDKRNNGNEFTVEYITRGHAEFFKDYAKQDLQNTMLRDRNHPSIFQWSIGNEIEWTYPKYNVATGYFGANAAGNYFWTAPPLPVEKIRENIKKLPRDQYEIGTTAQKLAKWTKEMDETRPVIANCILPSASYESGYTDALDIVGYSYRQVVYEYGHNNYPDKPIMGTENLGQWHEWKHVVEKDYIPGMFIWTGVDYIGEAGRAKPWPEKGTTSGLLDFTGDKKPSYYMFRSLWKEEGSIYAVSQTLEDSLYEKDGQGELVEKEGKSWKRRLWVWQDVNHHWNYKKKDEVVVEVYSNCDEVTLWLNDKSMGTKKLEDFEDRIYKWLLPYEEGEVKVVGVKDGKTFETCLKTAEETAKIQLTTDKNELTTDSDSAANIVARLYDKNGVPVAYKEEEITFEIQGDYKYLGIDNGDLNNVNDYQNKSIETYKGKAMIIVQAIGNKNIKVVAKCGDIVSNEVEILVK